MRSSALAYFQKEGGTITEKTEPTVVGRLCACGGKLKLDHIDDAKTEWFKCDKCGQQTANPKQPLGPERASTATQPQPVVVGDTPTSSELERYWNLSEAEWGKLSQADKIIRLCCSRNPTLFCDQTGAPYAQINMNGVNVTMPLHSQVFKAWLAGLLWEHDQKAPGSQAIYSALNVLTAMANSNPSKYTLYNRVAPAEDGFWLDMCDERWRAIKVTAEGWKIVDDPPILFKRYSHQLPLAEPKSGGNAWKLLDFINVDENDKNTRLTLLCTSISYLVPTIPHPIICAYGHQGSGKTWLFKLIRALIDPSAVEVLTIPWDERERVQQLDHHWCAFYDNITMLTTQLSDTLCRAATGSGFSKRELYTNDDDVIYSFKRCVGLNGINIAAQRGDLLDRSLLVNLSDISKENRKTEAQLLSEFEKCKAEILGGFLDTLVKALQLYPSINPKGLFRMADFTLWACAIATALGKTAEDFVSAYEEKVNSQIEEAAHSSPVATVLLDFLQSKKQWNDTPTRLYTELLTHAKNLGISTHQRSWPKAPHVLVRQLNELASSLKALGWEISTVKSGATKRIIVNSVPSDPSDPERDGRDARDASAITSCLLSVKNWCKTEQSRNGTSEISLVSLQDFIEKTLKIAESSDVVQKAKDLGIIQPSNEPGKVVVV